MPANAPSSHGGRFYRRRRWRELRRKEAYRARVESSYDAFRVANPSFHGSKAEFLRLVRQEGWVIPSHSRAHRPSARVLAAEKRFVEDGLHRAPVYRGALYTLADMAEAWQVE